MGKIQAKAVEITRALLDVVLQKLRVQCEGVTVECVAHYE